MTSYVNSFCSNVTQKDIQLSYLTNLLKSYVICNDHSNSIKCKYVPLQLRSLLVKEIQLGVNEEKIQNLGGLCSYIEQSAREQLFYQKIIGIFGDYLFSLLQIEHPLILSFKNDYLTETSKLSQDDIKYFITKYNYYEHSPQQTSLFASLFTPANPSPTDSLLKRSMCNMSWKFVIVFIKFASNSVFESMEDPDGNNLHKELINQQTSILSKTSQNIEDLLEEALKNNPLHRTDTCFTDDDASTVVENDYEESTLSPDDESLKEEQLLVEDNLNLNTEIELNDVDEQMYTHLYPEVNPNDVNNLMNTHIDLEVESNINNWHAPLIPDEYFDSETNSCLLDNSKKL